MNVTIEKLSPMRVAAIHHLGPYPEIGEAFARLDHADGIRDVAARPGAKLIALYHDDPATKPQYQLESDAGVVVPDGVSVPKGLVEIEVAGGRYAKTTYVGPYDGLSDAWSTFLHAQGEHLGEGTRFEIYRNTPRETPQEMLETELYAPLAG